MSRRVAACVNRDTRGRGASLPSVSTSSLGTIDLLGMPLARVDEQGLLDHLFQQLAEGQGRWVITANLDFLRRYVRDSDMRQLYAKADINVADGMPLVWAARIQGDPLPERVAGSALIWGLSERAAREGRSLYLLGGDEGAGPRAKEVLEAKYPGLRVVGTSSPWISNPPSDEEIAAIESTLAAVSPDIILVGFGSPKQEMVIERIRTKFPHALLMGVGISFSFVAGFVQRAPGWVQVTGAEWLHRILQEPRRLARRYIVDDIPFAIVLFTKAIGVRLFGGAARHDKADASSASSKSGGSGSKS
jgi:N-acetylglucosaminyldiphosphoundecaprenol N-acetyl-beta-D-mannosaminyltransferase